MSEIMVGNVELDSESEEEIHRDQHSRGEGMRVRGSEGRMSEGQNNIRGSGVLQL